MANTGGVPNLGGGQPLIPAINANTQAAGTAGVVFAGTVPGAAGPNGPAYGLNAEFQKIVTALLIRNTIEKLRTDAVFAQDGNMPLRATHIPGTNQFVYTGFSDLGPAETLLEGTPPEPEKFAWDTFSFGGTQIGKTVAITDLADLFNPYDLYSKGAELLAWNAVESTEDRLYKLLTGLDPASGAITGTISGPSTPVLALTATGLAAQIVEIVTMLKRREVPMYPDRTYHAYASPETLAKIMVETKELGWTDAMKYANPQALLNGEIGLFRGLRFIETNRMVATSDEIIVHGPGSFVIGDYQTLQAYRWAPGGQSDPLAQRGIMGWKQMWGCRLVGFDGTRAGAHGPVDNPEGYKVYKATLTP